MTPWARIGRPLALSVDAQAPPAPVVDSPLPVGNIDDRPHLVIRRRHVPVVFPSRRDPRLKLSAVIIALQVLGQVALGFKVSIAQILVTVAVCALLETAVTLWRQHALVWPASALLTGNSVAFILRASGTRHGDWWSLHGIQYFVLAAVLALLSKYLIRREGRHLFNPSNVGLVWTLLVIGPVHVFPQYLWWGPLGAPVLFALIIIFVGAVWILRSVGMVAMALAFWLPFAVVVGLFAAGGSSFIAIWHTGPVSGLSYWSDICASPELLIFVFFMMSDPKTAPGSRQGRVIYGVATAVLAAGTLFWQPTEFGIKVAILSSLTFVCVLVPIIDRVSRRIAKADGGWRGSLGWAAGAYPQWRTPVLVAAAIIAVAAPIDTIALTANGQIAYIERGLTGTHNPQ